MDWHELIHKYFFNMKKACIMSSSDEKQHLVQMVKLQNYQVG